jgi:tellurite resistance protein TerC
LPRRRLAVLLRTVRAACAGSARSPPRTETPITRGHGPCNDEHLDVTQVESRAVRALVSPGTARVVRPLRAALRSVVQLAERYLIRGGGMSSLVVPVWAWALLAAVVLVSISIDLFAHRGDHVDSHKRAMVWTGIWITVALAFNTYVYIALGSRAGEEFLAAYLLEKSLSVDNLFVFLLVFGALKIPRTEQRRVLTWGIFGAIVSRGILIFAGAAAVHRWHAITYVFGAILAIAALKLLREPRPDDEVSPVLHWLEKHVRWTRTLHGHRFFIKQHGRRFATPLFLALIAIELTDIVFAIDSVPAAFAVTEEPFIIFGANLLAILGLRALYIVLAGALAGLRYLRFGLATVLGFAGAKLLLASWIKVPPLPSVGVIAACIAISVIASLRANRRDARAQAQEEAVVARLLQDDLQARQVDDKPV